MSVDLREWMSNAASAPREPLDYERLRRNGLRRRLRRRLAAGGALSVLAVAVIALGVVAPTGRQTIDLADAGPGQAPDQPSPQATPSDDADALTHCRGAILSELELRVTDVPVGSTLGPTIRAGMRPGFSLGPLVSLASDDPDFVTPWQAVSAVVHAGGGEDLGVATWLSPHPVATFDPDAGVPLDRWLQDPAAEPQATHVRSANNLASQVSLFASTDTTASAIGASQRCARAVAG